jgi:hypothetical protein
MVMEVHGTFERDIDHLIECACLFHDRQSRDYLLLSFYIQFFKQRVNIVFPHPLAFAIEKKDALAGDACSRPAIKSHDLHGGDIRGAMGEIASCHKRD